MTIHFFTFSDAKGGSSRQRAFCVAEALQKRGMKTVIHTPPVLFISRTSWPKKFILIIQTIHALFSIKKGDVIFLQRAIANKYFFVIMVAYLILFHRKMIFDLDDPIWTHSFFKTKTLTRMADAVIVCSHAQAEWARKFNSNVYILHIALDMKKYERCTKEYLSVVTSRTIGWIGTGPEHLHNLEILVLVFKKLVTKTTVPFKFVLIGALNNQKVYDLFQNISGLTVEFIDTLDWSDSESVPREIQKFDIGVLPHQSEGEWNKNKSSFKVLEYMACGVTTIASSFGEMPYIIQDGVNGYLASSEKEWVEKLEQLLTDSKLMTQLGSAGQKQVSEQYSFKVVIPRYINIIESLR